MKTNTFQSAARLRVLPAFLLLLTLGLWSCELFDKDKHPKPGPALDNKQDPQKPPPGSGGDHRPRTSVPDQIVGTWADGSFDFELWENYREGYWAGRNAVAVREAMIFQKNGDAKYYRYEKATYIDEELIDCTGTVTFNGDGNFTFYPKQGRKRYYDTLHSTKYDRPLQSNELADPKIAGKRAYTYISSANPPQMTIKVPSSAPYKWYKLK